MARATSFALASIENDLHSLNAGEPTGQVLVERGVMARHDDEEAQWAQRRCLKPVAKTVASTRVRSNQVAGWGSTLPIESRFDAEVDLTRTSEPRTWPA